MAYNPPIGSIYHLYTTYILPSRGLYNPYHLLPEPEKSIDLKPISKIVSSDSIHLPQRETSMRNYPPHPQNERMSTLKRDEFFSQEMNHLPTINFQGIWEVFRGLNLTLSGFSCKHKKGQLFFFQRYKVIELHISQDTDIFELSNILMRYALYILYNLI